MSWLGDLLQGPTPEDPAARDAALQRLAEWEGALGRGGLPGFVTARLHDAAAGRAPWLSTMTPAELLLARTHGIRPVATVSGTCWLHYGFSWTNGHAEGWHAALGRIGQEAQAAGANAVVDATLRTTQLRSDSSMDFTIVGTAVRMDGLPPSAAPVIATVPAIEFVRLLEAGIVPTGVAVGGHYEWLTSTRLPDRDRSGRARINITGDGEWNSRELAELSHFWDSIRKNAIRKLRDDVESQHADGVLGHTHFAQLLGPEDDDDIKNFLGRHIVIGTTVQCEARSAFPHPIRTVIDMRDGGSPLLRERPHGHTAYASSDTGGVIWWARPKSRSTPSSG